MADNQNNQDQDTITGGNFGSDQSGQTHPGRQSNRKGGKVGTDINSGNLNDTGEGIVGDAEGFGDSLDDDTTTGGPTS